jgi:RNA polymerase sigma-70 factor (ECF subfamily)
VETKPDNTPTDALLRHVVAEDGVVRAYVYSVTRGHRETEDVIQEVWRVACQKIADFDDSRPFRPWILGITRLQLLKWRQALARSREVLAPDILDLLAETAETCREELDLRGQYLRECLKQMPGSGRRILHMKYFDGMKIAAIAVKLRKSVAAVEMALVRLRRVLRTCVDGALRASTGTSS